MERTLDKIWNDATELVSKNHQQNLDTFLKQKLIPAAQELLAIAPAATLKKDANRTILRNRQKLLNSVKKDGVNENEIIDIMNEYAQTKQDILVESELVNYTNKKLKFQKLLNEYLSQEVKTIYVYVDSQFNATLLEVDSSEIIKEDMSRHTMRYDNALVNSKFSTMKTIQYENAFGLNETYKEVLKRARLYKSKVSSHNEPYKKALAEEQNKPEQNKKAIKEIKSKMASGAILILWQINSVWYKMKVSSEGDLNESYAAFYLNKQFNLFSSSGAQETDVNTFMTHSEWGVQHVDSISGLLQGDVTVGNIHYAIKSKGASVMGDSDLLVTAAIIASQKEQLTISTIQHIKDQLKSMGKERNKLAQSVSKTQDALIKECQQELQRAIDARVS